MPDYPGLGLPLRNDDWDTLDLYPHGAHSSDGLSESDLIYVRELAMIDVMEKLTDKPDWHKKVFDDTIVARWRSEALAVPDRELYKLSTAGKWSQNDYDEVEDLEDLDDDFSDKKLEGILNGCSFDCCIQELRSKAIYFEQTGIIPTIEACASVAKSDTLVTGELHQALRCAFDELKADQRASPDWHPNSGDLVQDLVHPSMYSLVYGRTRAFKEECVGVEDAIDFWAGKGTVIPQENDETIDDGRTNLEIPHQHWSNTYQWLPANVALQDNGSVKFTSYINNLHPTKYPHIYETIEKLLQTALPIWDQCLAMARDDDRPGAGRKQPRLNAPDNPDDNYKGNWVPEDYEACADVDVPADQLRNEYYYPGDPASFKEAKWRILRKPKLPDPEWEDVSYAPKQGSRLIDRFKDSGLQIIVKMASIELTPEKPNFPQGGWHIEGQMNEHICGTVLYYLDSENITDSHLSFRMQTPDLRANGDYLVGQGAYTWMESVFGTRFGGGTGFCLQNYGSVQTREGRLLAFPNILQHAVSPFRLVDPSKPGHRRFIALWFVDPNKRIISTANVPPQQMTWYAENLLGTTPESRREVLAKMPGELATLMQERGSIVAPMDDNTNLTQHTKLPAELMEMVRQYADDETCALPMGVEEAQQHRLKLMKERGAFRDNVEEEWLSRSYNFCEH